MTYFFAKSNFLGYLEGDKNESLDDSAKGFFVYKNTFSMLRYMVEKKMYLPLRFISNFLFKFCIIHKSQKYLFSNISNH